MSNNSKIRVLIVDDHPLTRAGLCSILENLPDIEVVAEAVDGEQAKLLASELKPDIMLLDLMMPGPKPDEISRWVQKHCPQTETLILTGHARDAFLSRMMAAGAVGFLDKDGSLDQLVESIRCAALGQVMFSADQVQRAQRWRSIIGDRWGALSKREREVLECLVQGLGNRAISEILGITLSTVRTHNCNIFKKLGVTNRCEAISFVLNNDLFF